MDQSIEQRKERVANHLLPCTAFEGRYGPPQSLRARMARYHTPGVSIAVINDFQIEWARGFGVCEAPMPDNVTPRTLFQAASISKPIFALAVMRLVQEGRLDLDEDVNVYLKSWRMPANEGWQPQVTLRQILSHSAGLTVHGFLGYQSLEGLPNLPQILNGEPPANSDKVEVNILPGLQTRYSGGGTIVAQQVLVDKLGKPLPDIMRELVLEPLGMTDSTYEQPLPGDWAAKAATGHPWKGIAIRGKHHVYPEMAAAGLWTTPTDLARVGIELLRVLDQKAPSLLEKEIVDEILSPQLPGQSEGEGEYFGLGFFCKGSGDSFHFEHSGWNEGFLALMRVYGNIGKGAVVMLNSNEGHPLLEEIMRAIAYEYEWPDVFRPEPEIFALVQPDDYAGTFLTEAGVEFTIISRNGNIALQLGHQSPLPLLPTSELEFFAEAVNTTVTFGRNEDGEITAMTVSQAGQKMVGEKK